MHLSITERFRPIADFFVTTAIFHYIKPTNRIYKRLLFSANLLASFLVNFLVLELVAVVAIGIVAYGVFCLVEARYRQM